jgi:hypothetical protein
MVTKREMFEAEYLRCIEAGDDCMNAMQRIIDQGCPEDLAQQINDEFEQQDG